MTELAIRDLAAAITLQAAKDYFFCKEKKITRAEILKDLRSPWMQALTNGTSLNVAEQLERNPEKIKARLQINISKEDL